MLPLCALLLSPLCVYVHVFGCFTVHLMLPFVQGGIFLPSSARKHRLQPARSCTHRRSRQQNAFAARVMQHAIGVSAGTWNDIVSHYCNLIHVSLCFSVVAVDWVLVRGGGGGRLTGTIPRELCGLLALTVLNLHQTSLHGTSKHGINVGGGGGVGIAHQLARL